MLLHLLQHRKELKISWVVAFLEDGPMVEQVRGLGVSTLVIEAGRLRNIGRFASTVARLVRAVSQERVDFILSWMPKAHIYASFVSALSKIPAIWYQLGVPEVSGLFDRFVTALPCAGVLTLSQAGYYAQRNLTPRRRTQLVYPGVELERYDPLRMPLPTVLRQQLGLPVDRPILGIVGRLQRWKGMHVLVEAMPRIIESCPDVYCVIVGGVHSGEPEYHDTLVNRISQLGLGDCIRMTGHQTNVQEWMQAMDVVVHASDREPFGIVVVEAMALGKAVVAGSAGGPAEIITEWHDGVLSHYGDEKMLAGRVLKLLEDPTLRESLGAAAKKRAAEFSTRRFALNCVAAVETLLGGSVCNVR